MEILITQNMQAIVLDYTGIIPSIEFYEPFTQTSYWNRQEVIINDLPSSGTYFVVIFDRNIISQDYKNSSVTAKKYSLAIGETEDFSPYDYFTTLPQAWFDTKFFFEDYPMPAAVISAAIAAPLIVTCYLIKGQSRQSKSQNFCQVKLSANQLHRFDETAVVANFHNESVAAIYQQCNAEGNHGI